MPQKPARHPVVTPPQRSAYEYSVARMNDESVEEATRDMIATRLLPYSVPRSGDLRVGKKRLADLKAERGLTVDAEPIAEQAQAVDFARSGSFARRMA